MVNCKSIVSLIAGTSVALAALPPFEAGRRLLPGAFVVEYAEGHDAASFYATMSGLEGHIRVQFDFEHFKGASIQTHGNATSGNAKFRLADSPAVKHVWPVYIYNRPRLDAVEVQPSGRSVRSDTFSPHVMMQVDQLRAQGIDGQGVKIAAIDSGVDYTHPALGGCFGKGCKVSFGYDLAGDAFTGGNQPKPDNDPMDCESHGTHVSGIIMAQANDAGFTGVAPGVTYGMYRVFGCKGDTSTDLLMAAAARAADDGADIISSSVGGAYGWTDDGFSYVLGKLANEKGIIPMVAASNDGEYGAFYSSSASNNPSVNAIAAVDLPETKGTGNTPSFFTSWGPTMYMTFKPQFAGPGRDILSTLPGNKYGKASGTSMSTPMVAGAAALIRQALGPVDPQHLQTMLAGTAEPLFFSDGSKTFDGLAPAAQQGAGLIQAMNAINSKIRISPSSLSFNDTEHMNSDLELLVTNAGNETVDYHLIVRPAVTVYVLPNNGSPYPSKFPNDQTSSSGILSASFTKFTLTAGETQVLHVDADPPTAVDTDRLALWSGFLYIKGSDNSAVSVPYQGLAGSLRNATTLPGGAVAISRANDPKHQPVAENAEFVLPPHGTATSADDIPLIVPNLALGTTLLTAQIIDASSGAVFGDFPGAPWHMATRGDGFGIYWGGGLNHSYHVGNGSYKIRVKALRIFGDPKNEADWDVSDSVTIKISFKS